MAVMLYAVFVLAMRRSDKNMQPLLAAENDAKNKLAAAILAKSKSKNWKSKDQKVNFENCIVDAKKQKVSFWYQKQKVKS